MLFDRNKTLRNKFAQFPREGYSAYQALPDFEMTGIEETNLRATGESVFKAIFTDSQFWVPFLVLLLGIALLIFLR